MARWGDGVNDKRRTVDPVRNYIGASKLAGIILGPNPAKEQRGIISNGVNDEF